jgi:uncharacterized membrane protein YGL010W
LTVAQTIVVGESIFMSTWLARYLVVPGAHVRIGDFHYQAELYDVFHMHWGSRLGHMVCTPIVVLGALTSLAALPLVITGLGALEGVPVASVVFAAGLAAYFFGLDALTGLVTTPIVAALLAVAVLVARASGAHVAWVGLAPMAIGAVAQAGSHLFEDLPPPWGAERTWKPLREVLRVLTPRMALGLATLVLVSFALEWWASFRILGLQMNFLAMSAGLRPDLVAQLERRRVEILAGAG